MINTFILIHSLWRWVLLLVAIVTIARAAMGYFQKQAFQSIDGTLGQIYPIVVDIQALIGIILLILVWNSPSQPSLLHPLFMLLALVLAHAVRPLSRGQDDEGKHRAQLVGFGGSLVLILVGLAFVNALPA
jgi:hypothetical protein